MTIGSNGGHEAMNTRQATGLHVRQLINLLRRRWKLIIIAVWARGWPGRDHRAGLPAPVYGDRSGHRRSAERHQRRRGAQHCRRA